MLSNLIFKGYNSYNLSIKSTGIIPNCFSIFKGITGDSSFYSSQNVNIFSSSFYLTSLLFFSYTSFSFIGLIFLLFRGELTFSDYIVFRLLVAVLFPNYKYSPKPCSMQTSLNKICLFTQLSYLATSLKFAWLFITQTNNY